MRILGLLRLLDSGVIHSLTPLILIDQIEEILIVRNAPGPRLPKVRYYCPPIFLRKFVLSRVLAKFLITAALIVRKRPKAIISYYIKASGIIALIASKVFRLPAIHNVISGPAEYQLLRFAGKDYKINAMEKILLYLSRHFDGVTTTGLQTKEYLIQHGIRENKIEILPDSVNMDRFFPFSVSKKYDVIAVSRLDPVKKLDNFLRVVAVLSSEKSDIRVAIVGDGPMRNSLEKLASKLSISKNVDFFGHKENVEYFYNLAAIYVLTSEREGFPMTVLEAMGCGLPCVISNVGDVPDLAVDGYNAILVDKHDDIRAYADGVMQLLNDETLYRKISGNAYKTVREWYSYKNAGIVWERILNKVVNRKGDR